MTTATRRPFDRSLALVAAAVLGLLGLAVTAAPASADATAPQLSITVDDGRTEVEGGATLAYRVTITNLGGRRLRDLTVDQTVPPSATLASANKDGSTTADGARWSVDIPAGGSVTLGSSVEVADQLPADLLRLATVVCVRTSPTAAPIVCGSDSDQLPAGAAAEQQRQQLDALQPERPRGWLMPTGALAGGLLLIGVALALAAARRRARTAPGRRPVSHQPGTASFPAEETDCPRGEADAPTQRLERAR